MEIINAIIRGKTVNSPSRLINTNRSAGASMIISLTLVEIFFAGSTLVATATFACIGSYTLASIETRRITYRHTIYSIS